MDFEKLGFKSAFDRMGDEKVERQELARDPINFGIKFLDSALHGMAKHDLLLIGAKTGVGKTELINTIAEHNAHIGKKVFLFALEAEPKEMEKRIKFRSLMRVLKARGLSLTYPEWLWCKYSDEIHEVEATLSRPEYLKNLHTFYRTGDFGIKEFEKIFAGIEHEADLIIVDHIHFFDHETENENKELTEIAKRIRDLVLLAGVPCILVGHLRKPSEFSKRVLPDVYDFHGSSNLPKQITKAIIIEGGGLTEEGKFITYIRTAKYRAFGAATRIIGKLLFNPSTNEYDDDYRLAVLVNKESEIREMEPEEYPKWMK